MPRPIAGPDGPADGTYRGLSRIDRELMVRLAARIPPPAAAPGTLPHIAALRSRVLPVVSERPARRALAQGESCTAGHTALSPAPVRFRRHPVPPLLHRPPRPRPQTSFASVPAGAMDVSSLGSFSEMGAVSVRVSFVSDEHAVDAIIRGSERMPRDDAGRPPEGQPQPTARRELARWFVVNKQYRAGQERAAARANPALIKQSSFKSQA